MGQPAVRDRAFITWLGMRSSFLRQLRCNNTRVNYGSTLKQFRQFLTAYDRDLDPIFGDYISLRKAVEAWVWEQGTEIKESSISTKLSRIKEFYDYLVSDYMVIDKNPAYRIRVTNLDAPTVLVIPESDDVDALLANIKYLSTGMDDIPGRRDGLLIRFLREGGFRASEVLPLTLGDCNISGSVKIRIGKGNKSRTTAVLPETVQEAYSFASQFGLEETDYLFMSTVYYKFPWTPKSRKRQRDGAQHLTYRGLGTMLGRRAKEAGFTKKEVSVLRRAHSYRHLWAVEHVKAKTDHILLMRMAGWSSSSMINYYIGETALDVHAVRR